MKTDNKTTLIPASDLQFNLGKFELQSEDFESEGKAAVRLVARSPEPIHNFYFGRVVHDFDGMIVDGDAIPIDYCHNESEILGSINKFSIDGELGLVLDGAVIGQKTHQRVEEILHNMKAGVPYESSISFIPSKKQLVIEEVEPDNVVEVNGREFTGPLTIIREWPLRAVAICPLGADSGTRAEALSQNNNVQVEVIRMDKKNEQKKPEELTAPAGDAVVEPKVEAPVEEPKVEEPKVETPDSRAEFSQFADAFGDAKGAEYYKQGLSFTQATAEHMKFQDAQIAELKEASKTVPTPVVSGADTFSASDDSASGKTGAHVEGITPSLRKIAQMTGQDPEVLAKNKLAKRSAVAERKAQ